jgi:hypothetical protein
MRDKGQGSETGCICSPRDLALLRTPSTLAFRCFWRIKQNTNQHKIIPLIQQCMVTKYIDPFMHYHSNTILITIKYLHQSKHVDYYVRVIGTGWHTKFNLIARQLDLNVLGKRTILTVELLRPQVHDCSLYSKGLNMTLMGPRPFSLPDNSHARTAISTDETLTIQLDSGLLRS